MKKFSFICLLLLAVWTVYLKLPAYFDVAQFSMLDIGQGDSLLLQSPSGRVMLFDTGNDALVLYRLGDTLPFYNFVIDDVFITHFDQDHVGGVLDVLHQYSVKRLWVPNISDDEYITEEMFHIAAQKGIDINVVDAPMNIKISEGEKLHLLWPMQQGTLLDKNNQSIVAMYQYGDTKMLLTGDIEKEVEKVLLDKYDNIQLQAHILKVAHHGSKTSTTSSFLATVSPEIALVSAGYDNSFGHPHERVLHRLRKYAVIYETATFGTIHVWINQNCYHVNSSKKSILVALVRNNFCKK